MLIIYHQVPNVSCDCRHWYLAETVPCIDVQLVNEVVATGDELLAVKEVFKNLPYPSYWVREDDVRWFGDHAKFIAGNLSILARWQR